MFVGPGQAAALVTLAPLCSVLINPCCCPWCWSSRQVCKFVSVLPFCYVNLQYSVNLISKTFNSITYVVMIEWQVYSSSPIPNYCPVLTPSLLLFILHAKNIYICFESFLFIIFDWPNSYISTCITNSFKFEIPLFPVLLTGMENTTSACEVIGFSQLLFQKYCALQTHQIWWHTRCMVMDTENLTFNNYWGCKYKNTCYYYNWMEIGDSRFEWAYRSRYSKRRWRIEYQRILVCVF